MQMNGLAELITVAKYWKEWSAPRLVVCVLNNHDLNMVTWEERVLAGDKKFDASQHAPRIQLRTGERDDSMAIFPFSGVTNNGYTTIDVNVQYRLAHVSPFVKIENLRNAEYEEVVGYASPTRRVVVGLKF
jgi:outer membrane cobalamin receptor